jgi:MFS family permease
MTTPPSPRPTRGILRMLVVDIAPLRANPGFRWLFVGLLGSMFARQVMVVAVPYEIYVRTGSTLYVGLAGLVQVAPIVIFALVGGVIADAYDRARILVGVEIGLGLTAVLLSLNSGTGHLWPIFALVVLNAALNGVENPTRTAMIPTLVTPAQLPSAFALNQSLVQTMYIVGPASAGLLIAHVGIGVAYVTAAVASGISVCALWPIRNKNTDRPVGHVSPRAVLEAWAFLREQPILMQVMIIDLVAMVFGLPRALFPAIGIHTLGGDAATVGLLYAAPGVGALAAAMTSGWVGVVNRQGRAVVISVLCWGFAIAGFGVVRTLPLSLLLLAVAGGSDVVSNIFRQTILQARLPDHLRGRVTAFKGALSGSASPLGDAEAGGVASATTPAFAVVSGGLASVVGALVIAVVGGGHLWRQRKDAGTPDVDAPQKV